MNDGMLSQDEIDALLRGSVDDNDLKEEEVMVLPIEDFLSNIEIDALGEIGNISIGSSATALSTLLNQKVDITTPSIHIVETNKLKDEFPEPYVAVYVNYTVGFEATNLFVINTRDAAVIANLMLGGDGLVNSAELDEIQLSAVQEAMNQMMGSAATSMSQIFSKKVDISPPFIDLLNFKHGVGTDNIPSDDMLVKVSFRLKVGDLIDSNIMQLLSVPFAKELVDELLHKSAAVEEAATVEAAPPLPVAKPMVEPVKQHSSAHYTEQQMQAPSSRPAQPMNVQPAVFSDFQSTEFVNVEAQNLNLLYDIPLKVTVELGRTKRSVKDILDLATGSIIELDKLAGEPVDILVNNKLIAQGEVVVIDENFGVRVTDIISQSARLNKLG
ncbi:flagellar motor switch phosphatase FliY [Priestia taiwanensis]|uniref:Flagellar motor switch phosphatase FliY n=1 Tax=Priestia taiwanensis TaxID=1347902 RepID=A0A917APW9_9BACI|nr:flagellar motor switch phosphatase FliY [Priestia taiwanensis]MBM7362832.1 flagellar motor switch protein FliN/FliY [Priestia taiwanensis]GGE65463.1 flagellar motor switch phosphatase FliY [Priestia taiwanensis]